MTCILSVSFSSKIIASTLLLINDSSNSLICKSLSSGTETIPPNKQAKCEIAQ